MYYTTTELSRLTGVSLRRLQWWDEQGILSADRDSLQRRIYSQQHAVKAMLIDRLTGPPHSLQVSKVARKLPDRLVFNGSRFLIFPIHYNHWKGKEFRRALASHTPDDVIRRCAAEPGPVVLVDLADIEQKLALTLI